MIQTNTLLAITATIAILIITIISLVCIKLKRDILTTIEWSMSIVILAIAFSISILVPRKIEYEGGMKLNNIESISFNEDDSTYKVTVLNNMYNINEAVNAEETSMVLNCKVINTSILGIKTYKVKDILFVDTIDDTMSESEKQSLLRQTIY